ncbi:MAG: hypothetical protein AAFZ07_25530 [Actinomycetota bacterium]
MSASALVRLHPTALPPGVGLHSEDDGRCWVLRAERELSGLATGRYAEPSAHVRLRVPDGAELLGFAVTQFALPVRFGADLAADFRPAPNLRSHPAVVPLLVRADDRCCLLAPLDAWHEQLIAVGPDRGLRWGWHGDLDVVPAGFETTLGWFEGSSPGELLDLWGETVRGRHRTRRRSRDSDPVTSHLSYWTDNGAAYWYRTEAGRDVPSTLADKVEELRHLEVPIRAVELDSWFYPHEVLRPVAEVGYPEDVPPTGMATWDARPDVLPDGLDDLAARLGRPPLVLHARHVSPRSPYVEEGDWWIDRLAAQPVDPSFFRRWFDDAARWGATCVEQDWMLLHWLGVRQLRERPGRAMAWQRALDEAAAATGISLLWCMATPGDLLATVELDHVVAVRTCDDYRFADDPAVLWHWYLTVNRLAVALELRTFKDCFFSAPSGATEIDGDPHPEVEALLSAFSGGPAGIGDRLARTARDLVMRLCDDDGRLLGPDRPLALADQSLFRDRADPSALCWATTTDGSAHYVVALHTADTDEPITDRFGLASLVGDAEVTVHDWRTGSVVRAAQQGGVVEVTLARRDWALLVLLPIETDEEGAEIVRLGDRTKFATRSAPGPGEVVRLA